MKITNKYGWPEVFVRACQNDKYNKGQADFSCTELLKPPLQIRLQRQHAHELEEDVSSRLWSLLGTAVHSVLEQAAFEASDAVTEKRVYMQIGGVVVSGAIDHYDVVAQTITDYKFTRIYALKYPKPEHEQQLNIQALLMNVNGFPVSRVCNCYILRDWDHKEVWSDDGYPTEEVVVKEQKLWTLDDARLFTLSRISVIQHAISTNNVDEIEKCNTWRGMRCQKFCNVATWCPRVKHE